MAQEIPPPPPPPGTPPPPPGSSSVPPPPGAPLPQGAFNPTMAYRGGSTIVDRAKNILITPKPEWEIVDREQSNVAAVFTSYVLPMLFIGAFATFIGFGLIGHNGIKLGAGQGLVKGLIFIIFTSVLVFAMAATIEILAPSFAAEKNWTKSFKLAAYSLTAAYLGSIFWLFPALWILVLLCSLYSLYALYTGIAGLKKTAEDKQVAYFAVVLLATVVLYILMSLLFAEIYKAFQPRPGLRIGNIFLTNVMTTT